MNPMNIEAKEYPIAKVFSNDFVFEIPEFQRQYAWTTEQAGELLDDILLFMGNGDQAVEDLNPYFLGIIVLIKEDDPEAEVVDGQQRLATLTILLAVLRELSSSSSPKFADGITGYLYEAANPVVNNLPRYRLKLGKQSEEFFRKYIQDEGGLNSLAQQPVRSGSRKNIRDNAECFLKELRPRSEEQRQKLVKFIIDRCYLVVISTRDVESAYRIFAVLNDRGLNLSHTDILKARIIGEIPEAKRGDYTEKWEDEEAKLGHDLFQSLFSHIRMIKRKTKARNLLTEFRDNIRPQENPQEFIDNTLQPMADAFSDISYAAYESATCADKINETLKWLNRVDNVSWVPPALSYVAKYRAESGSPEIILRFLRDLERLASGLMILRRNTNRCIERYGHLLTAIEEGADLYQETSPLQLTAEERKEIVEALNGDIYNVLQIRTQVLLRLDSAFSGGGVEHDHPIITIEHVLPQNPPAKSEWLDWFPDEEQRDNLTHKIGNLAPLPRSVNARARNFDFQRKKREYFQRENAANFTLTNQVLAQEKWTPEVVEQRQTDLVNKLKKVWRL